jgi:hypothetical protein
MAALPRDQADPWLVLIRCQTVGYAVAKMLYCVSNIEMRLRID